MCCKLKDPSTYVNDILLGCHQSFQDFVSSQEFRLYAIDSSGSFADDSFDFHQGTMQKAFEGWIRLAEDRCLNAWVFGGLKI